MHISFPLNSWRFEKSVFHCNKMARSFYNSNNQQHALLGCREYYKRVQMCPEYVKSLPIRKIPWRAWRFHFYGKGLVFTPLYWFRPRISVHSFTYTGLFFYSAHFFIRSSPNHSFTQSFVHFGSHSSAYSVPFIRWYILFLFFLHFFIPLFTGSFLPYFYTESCLFNTLRRSTGDFGRSSHGSHFAVKSVAPKYAWRAKPNLPPKSQRKVRFTIPKSSQVSMIS